MLGVIDVGGGLRGAYGAGVFDYCLDNGISFDHCIGVSAGSANIVSYCAGQRGRNYRFYTDYSFRSEYMSPGNFLKRGSYIDLDYIYGKLSAPDGEDPLDFDALKASGKTLQIVCTDADTGRAKYFTMDDISAEDFDAVKASCSVPVVNQPYFIKGVPYFDGGISNPIPINEAFRQGCTRVVVILTRPREDVRDTKNDFRFSRFIAGKYPRSAKMLARRGTVYNLQLELIKKYEAMGKVCILAPGDIAGMKTLTRDRNAIRLMYKEGYTDACALEQFISTV